jgi:hypothetical protein
MKIPGEYQKYNHGTNAMAVRAIGQGCSRTGKIVGWPRGVRDTSCVVLAQKGSMLSIGMATALMKRALGCSSEWGTRVREDDGMLVGGPSRSLLPGVR